MFMAAHGPARAASLNQESGVKKKRIETAQDIARWWFEKKRLGPWRWRRSKTGSGRF